MTMYSAASRQDPFLLNESTIAASAPLRDTAIQTLITVNIQSGTTTGTALTAIDESAIIPNGTIVTKIGMYQATAKTVTLKIAKKNSAGNYDIVVNQSFAHPGGGWADATLATPYTVPATGSYYLGGWSSGTSSVVLGTVVGAYVVTTDVTGNGQTLTEDPAGGTWALRYTGSPTMRNTPINPALKTLVLIFAGQSNACNILPAFYSPPNGANIDCFNIYDGCMYTPSGQLLGCTGAGAPGHIGLRVANLFIPTFDRVILVPTGVDATAIEYYGVGPLADRGPVAMRRLRARGIVPGMTGVTFAKHWMIGEGDAALGTSVADQVTMYTKTIAADAAEGFVGRTFITLESYRFGSTFSNVRTAQANMVNGTTVFQSGDIDTLTAGSRQGDNLHLSDAGGASAATLIYNAMHASGAPY